MRLRGGAHPGIPRASPTRPRTQQVYPFRHGSGTVHSENQNNDGRRDGAAGPERCPGASVRMCSAIGPRDENQDYAAVCAEIDDELEVVRAVRDGAAAELECDGRRLLAVLADGMGGLERGGEASIMAVDSLIGLMSDVIATAEEDIAGHVADRVAETSDRLRSEIPGSGSTLVMAVIEDGRLDVFHAGDSRCYVRLRDGRVTRTADHSVVDLLIRMGAIGADEAEGHPMRNKIFNHLGGDVTVDRTGPTEDWEHIMLCSDGVSSCLSADGIKRMMEDSADAEVVIAACLAAGPDDNVTCLTITRNGP